MDHILKHMCEHQHAFRETRLLDQLGVSQEDIRREAQRIAEPLPRKQTANKKCWIIGDIDFYDELEGDVEHQCEGKGIHDGPGVSENAALVSDLHLFPGEDHHQIPITRPPAHKRNSSTIRDQPPCPGAPYMVQKCTNTKYGLSRC